MDNISQSVPEANLIQPKKMPGTLKVLIVLGYVGVAGLVIGGLLSFSTNVVLALVLFIIAALAFVVNMALSKGKNWARIVNIVCYSLSVLMEGFTLLAHGSGSLVSIIVSIIFLYYYAFDKNIKTFFLK